MALDKFGRTSKSSNNKIIDKFGLTSKRPLNENILKITSNGDYDFQSKRLVNVIVGSDGGDATNKHYVDEIISLEQNKLSKFSQNIGAALNVIQNKISKLSQDIDAALNVSQNNARAIADSQNKIIELSETIDNINNIINTQCLPAIKSVKEKHRKLDAKVAGILQSTIDLKLIESKVAPVLALANANSKSIHEVNQLMAKMDPSPIKVGELYEHLADVRKILDNLKTSHEKLLKDVNRLHRT